jgi:ADP-heptose:LPS heptosyltransferase
MTRNRTTDQIARDTRFFRLAGVQELLGAEYLGRNLLPTPIPIPTPETVSETEFLLELLENEGVAARPDPIFDLALTGSETSSAYQWIEKTGNSAAKLIAVAPGSKWPSKVWSTERFYEVVSRLIREFDVTPIVFGGSEDRKSGERLIERWGRGTVAAGELNVRQSAALLTRCCLYLGNDTGAMHLAAAAGIPCVAIFAAVDWLGRWKPYGENHRTFRKHVECEGCHSPFCNNGNKCLDLIDVDEVYEACKSIMIEAVRESGDRS